MCDTNDEQSSKTENRQFSSDQDDLPILFPNEQDQEATRDSEAGSQNFSALSTFVPMEEGIMDIHHPNNHHPFPQALSMTTYNQHHDSTTEHAFLSHHGYGFHQTIHQNPQHLQLHQGNLHLHQQQQQVHPHQQSINHYHLSPPALTELHHEPGQAMMHSDPVHHQNSMYQNSQPAFIHRANAGPENAILPQEEGTWGETCGRVPSLEELRWRDLYRNVPARGKIIIFHF